MTQNFNKERTIAERRNGKREMMLTEKEKGSNLIQNYSLHGIVCIAGGP